jgi:hypothetical protein
MLKRSCFVLTAFSFIFIIGIGELEASSAFNFLRYTSSARAAGIAGCFVSIPNDPSALFFNPASVATVTEKPLSATFFKHILDINSGSISFITNYKDWGTFAASAVYTSYGSFDRADATGNITGDFSASDISFGISYANKLDTNLFWGATAKFIYETIDTYSSSAFAVDLGLLYLLPDNRTNIGVSILHSGFQISKFENTSESLPLDIRMGVSHRLEGLPLLVNLTFKSLADKQDNFFERFLNFSIGGELYLGQYIQVRLGYDNEIRRLLTPDNNKKLSGFSGGLGIKLKEFNIDYAAQQVGLSALLHKFSINFNI